MVDLIMKEKEEMITNIKSKLGKNGFVERWLFKYDLALEFYKDNGHLLIPIDFKTNNGIEYAIDGFELGVWIYNQKRVYKTLSDEKKQLLDAIDILVSKWDVMYKLAKKYFEYYGHVLISKDFKTKDGILYDEDGLSLGLWINAQKANYNNMDSRKKLLLDEINLKLSKWEVMYNFAKKYYENYKHLNIPNEFKTRNGYEYASDGIELGVWLYWQRHDYKDLTDDRKKLLSEIKFEVKKSEIQYMQKYELAKRYYEYYGHLKIPQKFKTNDGIEYDDDGVALGTWLYTQRRYYDGLSFEKKKLLSEIGFELNLFPNRWLYMYDLASNYYKYHGHLNISQLFKTKNGYEYDGAGVALGTWLYTQRTNYDILSDEKKLLLSKIGFNFKKKRSDYDILISKDESIPIYEPKCEIIWKRKYELAKNYYEYYGHLNIPRGFKTINGYIEDEDGIELGGWILYQRKNFMKLSNPKKRLLDSIGMIWNYWKNRDSVMSFCSLVHIDYMKNSDILKFMSEKELKAKFLYLVNNGYSLVDNDGRLHEIFSMSSLNMEAKYGVTLEGLLKKDFVKVKKR